MRAARRKSPSRPTQRAKERGRAAPRAGRQIYPKSPRASPALPLRPLRPLRPLHPLRPLGLSGHESYPPPSSRTRKHDQVQRRRDKCRIAACSPRTPRGAAAGRPRTIAPAPTRPRRAPPAQRRQAARRPFSLTAVSASRPARCEVGSCSDDGRMAAVEADDLVPPAAAGGRGVRANTSKSDVSEHCNCTSCTSLLGCLMATDALRKPGETHLRSRHSSQSFASRRASHPGTVTPEWTRGNGAIAGTAAIDAQ